MVGSLWQQLMSFWIRCTLCNMANADEPKYTFVRRLEAFFYMLQRLGVFHGSKV